MQNNKIDLNNYRQCLRCVMDTNADNIEFDERGYCNYCNEYIKQYSKLINETPNRKIQQTNKLIEKIQLKGKNKPYDCIIGVSGGVDSSWVIVKAVESGLRPLAIHMDNGWNSELAQNNIERLVKTLNVDLFTYVIDWNEFRDLQESFFNADVIDIELLTDNAIMAILYQQARKYKIRYILAGSNSATEGVRMPSSWAAVNKMNKKNIVNIWKSCGKGYPLKSFPIYSSCDYIKDTYLRKIEWVRFLDLLDYKKSNALKVLQNEYGYIPYPYKHYESIFTRIYQGIILPRKFNVDKRLNHLSSLILSGDLKREEALDVLKEIPYPSIQKMESDLEYFLKKFEWNEDKFNRYINRPKVEHAYYGEDPDFLKIQSTIIWAIKVRLGKLIKK